MEETRSWLGSGGEMERLSDDSDHSRRVPKNPQGTALPGSGTVCRSCTRQSSPECGRSAFWRTQLPKNGKLYHYPLPLPVCWRRWPNRLLIFDVGRQQGAQRRCSGIVSPCITAVAGTALRLFTAYSGHRNENQQAAKPVVNNSGYRYCQSCWQSPNPSS